jgi:hypothetical protein
MILTVIQALSFVQSSLLGKRLSSNINDVELDDEPGEITGAVKCGAQRERLNAELVAARIPAMAGRPTWQGGESVVR